MLEETQGARARAKDERARVRQADLSLADVRFRPRTKKETAAPQSAQRARGTRGLRQT